jgi:hypothetical protein
MAKLQVSAIPSGTLESYELNIHGHLARDGDTIEIAGQQCGDGSTQFVRFKLTGPAGASLALELRCPREDNPDHVVLKETLQIPPDVVWFKL